MSQAENIILILIKKDQTLDFVYFVKHHQEKILEIFGSIANFAGKYLDSIQIEK